MPFQGLENRHIRLCKFISGVGIISNVLNLIVISWVDILYMSRL